MQSGPLSLPPAGVLFDAPLGNRVEDVLAMALLYALDAKDQVRAAVLSVSKSNLEAAQFCESLARFFLGGSPFLRLPVGLSEDRYALESSPMFAAVLRAKDEAGEWRYPHSIQKMTDTADNVPLLRNALTGFHDRNAMVVCTGRATNLARLLALPGAKEVIAKKARLLVLTDEAKVDGAALAKVVAGWPTPVVVAGEELDRQLRVPLRGLVEKLSWTKEHPVVAAWQAAGEKADPAGGAALAAVYHAAQPKSEDLVVVRGADGPGRLQVTAGGAERLVGTWLEWMAFKPEPRRRRPMAPPVKPETAPAKPAETAVKPAPGS